MSKGLGWEFPTPFTNAFGITEGIVGGLMVIRVVFCLAYLMLLIAAAIIFF
jgi:hypothetical protein